MLTLFRNHKLERASALEDERARTCVSIHVDGTIVGYILIFINGEIQYHIYEDYQGNGFCAEALTIVVGRFDWYCHLREPFLKIARENNFSQKVAKKCGFICNNLKADIQHWTLKAD